MDVQLGIAVLDYFGEKKKARADFFTPAIDDYVYAQGGFVIQKVSRAEALSSLEAWKELFFELKKIDDRLSRVQGDGSGVETRIARILNRAQSGAAITRDEALALMEAPDAPTKRLLFETANAVRQKILGNSCCVHGIIEFSNCCRCDCLYCGIRRPQEKLARYRMTPAEIIESVEEAARLGFKALVLQSGEDEYYTADIFEDIMRTIRKNFGSLVFLSVGEKGNDFYSRMFDAGARGVLVRFETSNEALYARMRPGHTLTTRRSLLDFLRKKGFVIATGALLGLPGQTRNDMIEDIFMAQLSGAEMYSFGPFIPHPDTPLADSGLIAQDEVLKFIAVARLAVPDAKILVTTALETLGRDARRLGLVSGANSFMLNATPLAYRKMYDIYRDRAGAHKATEGQVEEALALLKELGRAPTDLGITTS